jgi:N-acetylglucosamine-6-sulfatase
VRKGLALALVGLIGIATATLPPVAVTARPRPNVIIILSDDQRWDKVTAKYMPNVYALSLRTGSVPFRNAFVSNPGCCPSRSTILTGRYSHTTGVWDNGQHMGGFGAFDDKHTLAVDFQAQGYRTAMIGKYLNGYPAGRDTYVPPGWGRWFALRGGVYYDYGVTTKRRLLHFGKRSEDYATRVLQHEAIDFVTAHNPKPFFLYLSATAPHGPAIPDPRDIGRFAGDADFTFDRQTKYPTSSLESAYGVDRAVGRLLAHVPDDTVVLYMSDNGYMWKDATPRGEMSGKLWPYNESIRVPMIYASLDDSIMPNADAGDVVANVDLRTTLLHTAELAPLTSQEGINWFGANYSPRDHLVIEHYATPTYCGIRQTNWMYARFHDPDGSYVEELYNLSADPFELNNLAATDETKRSEMYGYAEAECDPPPPGYAWEP